MFLEVDVKGKLTSFSPESTSRSLMSMRPSRRSMYRSVMRQETRARWEFTHFVKVFFCTASRSSTGWEKKRTLEREVWCLSSCKSFEMDELAGFCYPTFLTSTCCYFTTVMDLLSFHVLLFWSLFWCCLCLPKLLVSSLIVFTCFVLI